MYFLNAVHVWTVHYILWNHGRRLLRRAGACAVRRTSIAGGIQGWHTKHTWHTRPSANRCIQHSAGGGCGQGE